MRNRFLLLAFVLISLQSCDLNFLDCYDGDFVNKEIVLDEINAIEIDFPCEIVMVDGTTQAIRVNAKQDLIDDLEDKSSVSGKIWKVRLKNNCIKHREDITFTITVPGLKKLKVDGSTRVESDGKLTNLNSALEFDFDGDSDVRLDEVNLSKLTVNADGEIDLSINGFAETANYNLDGSGIISSHNLQTAFTSLTMDGDLVAEIWVTEKLNANLDGSATVCLKGNPAVVSNIDGSGKIKDCN